jgi:two-component system chemotaxis sensor kinase CheA
MSDADLLNIFWIEVGEYLRTLNATLLQVETGTASDTPALLREMNRLAHSMKGASRAVGIGVIETIAHYMEEMFNAALNDKLALRRVCDLLYDGLDLVQTSSTARKIPPTLAEWLAAGADRRHRRAGYKEVPAAPPDKQPVTAIPIVPTSR